MYFKQNNNNSCYLLLFIKKLDYYLRLLNRQGNLEIGFDLTPVKSKFPLKSSFSRKR